MPDTIPTEVTSGELARVLEISERRVASLKAEGRLPVSGNGHVLLRELLARLYHAEADRKRRPARSGGPPEGASWDEACPMDAAARGASTVFAHMIPAHVARAAVEAGANVPVAYALHRLMRVRVLPLRRRVVVELCGFREDPDGPPMPACTLELLPPDWSALAEMAGEPLDLAAWDTYATERVGPAPPEMPEADADADAEA